jgi:hypothetical protein
MRSLLPREVIVVALVAFAVPLLAADTKIDLTKEQVGKPPAAFEPMVGTWVIAQDGPDKVVMVDGRPWVTSKDNPTKLLIENARKLYGTSNEELMDNAKQFAYYPVALVKGVGSFTNGTISMKFKTVSGDSDRCSGIVFNVKPNGDWLAIRYNDTEGNIVLWEFHNGIGEARPGAHLDVGSCGLARVEDDRRRRRGQSLDRREPRARVHARKRARARSEQCRSQPRFVPGEQPRAPPARRRPRGPLVEDRQHQLLQGFRHQSQVAVASPPPGSSGRWPPSLP